MHLEIKMFRVQKRASLHVQVKEFCGIKLNGFMLSLQYIQAQIVR